MNKSQPHSKGGFKCEFVDSPPAGLDRDCLICGHILCDPYQAICCGRSLCHDCVREFKSEGKPCPACEVLEGFKIFPNTNLKNHLYELTVYCVHKNKGCEWKGKLGEHDEHVNCNPPAENLLLGCQYTIICCPFVYNGCSKMLPRKDMTEHLNDDFINHQLTQASTQSLLVDRVKELTEENTSLKSENARLKEKVEKQQSFIQYREQQIDQMDIKLERMEREKEMASRSGTAIGPVRFVMEGFEQHKLIPDDNWYTPHFWTHPHGYKMCLCIIANGEGPAGGQFTSVLIHMMRGEFDDHLKWPFRGIINVQLVDQEGGNDNYSQDVHITKRTPDEVANRVTKGERTEKGWGLFQFISHSKLEPKYLKNDRLVFQIGAIQLTNK